MLERKGLRVGVMVATLTAATAVSRAEPASEKPGNDFTNATLPTPPPTTNPSDKTIEPGSRRFPPIVITDADKFALKVMAPSLSVLGLVGVLGGLGWVLKKVGVIKNDGDSGSKEK